MSKAVNKAIETEPKAPAHSAVERSRARQWARAESATIATEFEGYEWAPKALRLLNVLLGKGGTSEALRTAIKVAGNVQASLASLPASERPYALGQLRTSIADLARLAKEKPEVTP